MVSRIEEGIGQKDRWSPKGWPHGGNDMGAENEEMRNCQPNHVCSADDLAN